MVAILVVAAPPDAGRKEVALLQRITTVLRHRWIDDSDSDGMIPRAVLDRLTARVRASERQHTGEIRICVEASLPSSYLWRHVWQGTPMLELARQRATMQFSRLRVWDTENNNGVLIYLLVSERKIELLADRGVNAVVAPGQWRGMVDRMARAFSDGRFEDGLTQALEEVSAPLVAHFPASPGAANLNELPDRPAVD